MYKDRRSTRCVRLASNASGLWLFVCSLLLVMSVVAMPSPVCAEVANDQGQTAEDVIYQALAECREGPIDVSAFNIGESWCDNKPWENVICHHPELFYVEYYEAKVDQEAHKLLTITPHYMLTNRFSVEEILQMREKMSEGIASAMASIPADGTDLEKVRAAHDWLCLHVVYDNAGLALEPSDRLGRGRYGWTYDNDHFFCDAAYGAFAEGTCVCTGYAEAFDALMNLCGIEDERVGSRTHEWNKVRIDGVWYNIDCCWDASGTKRVIAEDGRTSGRVSYKYFLKSDQGIRDESHEERVSLAVATDTRYDTWKTKEWEDYFNSMSSDAA